MEIKNRKITQLEFFDYNSVGTYFITICTQDKAHLLSQVKLSYVGTGARSKGEPTLKPSPAGKVAPLGDG